MYLIHEDTMTESESFSSLGDLIDSHLSKHNIPESGSENNIDEMIRSSLVAGLGSSVSDTSVLQPSPRRFVMPGLNITNTAKNLQATSILAQQVSNTIQAREAERRRKEEEEKQKKAQRLNSEDDEIIDLMKCLQFPYKPGPCERPLTPEMEKFEINFISDDFEMSEIVAPKLPCIMDSDTYKKRVFRKRKRQISSIGRAICTKFRESREPYFPKLLKTDIVRFDFSTPSPDDIINATIKKRPILPRIFF